MNTGGIVGVVPGWMPAAAVILCGCGQVPPSIAEADTAMKQLPELQILVGSRLNDPNVHLVTDLKCSRTVDAIFLCQVLLPRSVVSGLQQTVPVKLVKLDGEWRAISSE
jgi:hypothetical protein